MDSREFDTLLSKYFDGKLEESQIILMKEAIKENPKRQALFDRMEKLYSDDVKTELEEDNDQKFVEKMAYGATLNPNYTGKTPNEPDRVLRDFATGKPLIIKSTGGGGVRPKGAERVWKDVAEDHFGSRMLAVVLLIFVGIGVYLFDRKWAKDHVEGNSRYTPTSITLENWEKFSSKTKYSKSKNGISESKFYAEMNITSSLDAILEEEEFRSAQIFDEELSSIIFKLSKPKIERGDNVDEFPHSLIIEENPQN